MWQPFSTRTRSVSRRSRTNHVRRTNLERLEERQLLSAAEFEVSSLLAVNGGDGSNGFVVTGTVDGGKLLAPKSYTSVGDVNQDGMDDLLLAASGIDQAYLIFGRPGGFPAELDLDSLNATTGYVISGADLGDSLGFDYGGGAGDVNHDGIPDMMIGAIRGTPSVDRLNAGQNFVLYGAMAHLNGLDIADGVQDGRIDLANLDGAHGFTINGVAAGDLAGRTSAAGDVNGDAIDDLIIGASAAGSSGASYVVYGRDSTEGQSFPAAFELSSLDGSNGFVIPSPPSGGGTLGASVGGAGDVNGDGISDLVLGDLFADPSGRQNAGRAYVIFGRPSFPATFDLTSLNGSNGFTVNGNAVNDYLGGWAVGGAGDVSGDGVDDVLIGAWGVDGPGVSNDGAAYVIFGKTTAFPAVFEVATLNGSNGFALLRTGGYSRSAGDVNGDGYADTITANSGADPNGLTDAGQSFIIYGRSSFGASFDVTSLLAATGGDGSAGYVLNGVVEGGAAGYVAGLGDINGDGYDDASYSAYSTDLNGLANNGQVYIIYGKLSPAPSDTKFYVVNDGSPDRTYEYGPTVTAVENYALNSGNTAPRGAASTAVGDKVWVVDANKNVYVSNTSGGLLGSWTAGGLASNATAEGIATDGTDVWIVDARQDRVYRYTGAASRLSGSQNAAGSFALNNGNTGPKDILTDGTNLWVVNDSTTDKVFKYTLSGSLAGSWSITGAGSSPTGITLDPSGGGILWIVDNGSDRVYQFDNARS